MKLVVSNLPETIDEKEIEQLFSRFGRVSQIRMLYNFYTQKFRGMAYVDMEDETSARSAVQQLNQSRVHENVITVEPVVSTKL